MSVRRDATPTDLPALVALDAEVFGDDAWSAASWAAELAQVPATRHVQLVTRADGVLLGYTVLMLVGDVADVTRIVVAPAARRAGLARELLAAALAEAQHRGCSRVLLEVAADNTPALALYQQAGFVALHRRAHYYAAGRDALVLELDG